MTMHTLISFFFFFNDTATTEIYTLSLHDALPIWRSGARCTVPARCLDGLWSWRTAETAWARCPGRRLRRCRRRPRSEEHTSELQSPCNLVCRLLLEKKKNSRLLSIVLHSARHVLS